ncbi:hypothetical protein GUJ93_ZPchr0002g25564 [Zizania palustris]|uniref:Uncharacterized protein n=1 Tax=Zizania palustris TaxID=103762 RepID=A0A8J5SFL5_ZIZPA|nr:hypothetical protein GUJ93_ZPchr0002g25564 [Zizania palustris]
MSSGSTRAHSFASPSPVSRGIFSLYGSAPSFAATAMGSAGSTLSFSVVAVKKPSFHPVADDTKPILRDPISRSNSVETEQAMLRLPPFP